MSGFRTHGGGSGGAPPGDSDYTASVGTDTQDVDKTIINFGAQPVGVDTQDSANELIASVTTAAGTDTGSHAQSQVTTAKRPVGTNTSDIDKTILDFGAQPVGTNTGSMTGGSVTTVRDFVDTATATVVGTPDDQWANETNAEGVDDTAVASITLAGGVGAPETADSALEMSFGAATAPPGTRGDVDLRIRHLLDTTMALTSNVTCTLTLSKSTGADPLVLITSIRATGSPIGDSNVRNDTVLGDETFDVTSHVSGWSEAELSSALLRANMVGTGIVAGGEARWQIDASELDRAYTVSSIT